MKKKAVALIFISTFALSCCASRSDEDAKAISDWSLQCQQWKRADSLDRTTIKAYKDTVNAWRPYVPSNH
jgi:hypothetical protein